MVSNETTADDVPAIMLPWQDWKDPQVTQTDLHAVFTEIDDDKNIILNMRDGEGQIEEFGPMSQTALKELSSRIGFPTEFIAKLSPELRPVVINDRIKSARKQKFSFVSDEDGKVIAASPGWRESISHREIAQLSYDALLNSEEVDSVTVSKIEREEGFMNLRFLTPIEAPITPRVGDILQLGLDVHYAFGTDLNVSLYTERLVCTNGMTNTKQDYAWSNDAAKTKGRQIEWLREAIHEAVMQYDLLVARAARMADTIIEGDMSAALYQRARTMKIPQRVIPLILQAFNEEPGNTEWHLVNAITRFATHHADRHMGSRLQREAGNMVENFTMATARLPLYVAQQSGFQVLTTEQPVSLAG